MKQSLDSALGKFARFAWLAILRSVQIETVSISGMPLYIVITRERTYILWNSLPNGVVDKCQDLGTHIDRVGDTSAFGGV